MLSLCLLFQLSDTQICFNCNTSGALQFLDTVRFVASQVRLQRVPFLKKDSLLKLREIIEFELIELKESQLISSALQGGENPRELIPFSLGQIPLKRNLSRKDSRTRNSSIFSDLDQFQQKFISRLAPPPFGAVLVSAWRQLLNLKVSLISGRGGPVSLDFTLEAIQQAASSFTPPHRWSRPTTRHNYNSAICPRAGYRYLIPSIFSKLLGNRSMTIDSCRFSGRISALYLIFHIC